MRPPRAAVTVVAVGLLSFVVVFTLLEFSPSRAESGQPRAPEPPIPTPISVATDSLAPSIDSGDLAIGVPIAGSEALLRNVQPRDRLDIVASFTAPQTGQPVTAILVRGATVLSPPGPTDPLLVEVNASDAVMLAHVVLRGTRLGYILWPAGGSLGAVTPPPIGESIARDALGLSRPTSVAVTPTAVAPPAPSATPQPRPGSGFLYQVQPNDTWQRIADIFGMPVGELRQWNESSDEPVPGTLVFIPRLS
jgi:hypothetical protein